MSPTQEALALMCDTYAKRPKLRACIGTQNCSYLTCSFSKLSGTMKSKLFIFLLIVMAGVAALFVRQGWDRLPPNLREGEAVHTIRIEGTINRSLANRVIDDLNDIEKSGYEAVVIYIDTPGGDINASERISDALLNSELWSIAYIEGCSGPAYSIAFACAELAFDKQGSISAPMLLGHSFDPKLEKSIRRKTHNRITRISEKRDYDTSTIEGILINGDQLTAQEALDLGISIGTSESLEEFISHFEKAGSITNP